MSEMWKRWEGQVIEHKYRLESLIGSTDHSVVFQAEYRSPEPRKAAVKFMAADVSDPDQWIAEWDKAAQLSHPNLIRILQAGKCKIEDMDLLYVAMECADENLKEIIPHRALTVEETREALNAIVDVLVYLHGKGLTHGHICPANILAVGEFLKVSSDTIEPVAEKRGMTRERSKYDAPEIGSAPYTQAADVWSLGVTVVEMLTQERVALPFNENADPVIPPTVREPFLEIARHALRRRPGTRWTSAQVAERLNPSVIAVRAAAAGVSAQGSASGPCSSPMPAGAAKAAAQSASVAEPIPVAPAATQPFMEPLSVPLSKEPAVPLAKRPRPSAPPMPVKVPGPRQGRGETLVLPSYALPVLVFVLILVMAVALPKILQNGTGVKSNPVAASAPAPVKRAPPTETAKATAPQTEEAAPPNSAARKAEARVSPPPAASSSASPSPAPAVMRSKESAPTAKARNSSEAQGRGEVLEQALPQVSGRALSTINGTVRVVVKTHVDEAGQVAGAELQDVGPSRYFADKAVQSAQRWVFASPEVNGRNIASDWLIRFEFTRDGVKAFPQQVTP